MLSWTAGVPAGTLPALRGGRELPRKPEEQVGCVRTSPSVSRRTLDSSPHCGGEHNAGETPAVQVT
jgi:hypothetical protein